ncbi:MAG TPA: 50S ribosomal protein L32 [Trueperaceae bacterium]|nr:50S ribosomal protein L32 [Trueperaceae bacterium]
MAKHPVPKKRTSSSRRDKRRSHHALTAPNLVECPQCKAMKPQHVVCPECGSYAGRQVVEEA